MSHEPLDGCLEGEIRPHHDHHHLTLYIIVAVLHNNEVPVIGAI